MQKVYKSSRKEINLASCLEVKRKTCSLKNQIFMQSHMKQIFENMENPMLYVGVKNLFYDNGGSIWKLSLVKGSMH